LKHFVKQLNNSTNLTEILNIFKNDPILRVLVRTLINLKTKK